MYAAYSTYGIWAFATRFRCGPISCRLISLRYTFCHPESFAVAIDGLMNDIQQTPDDVVDLLLAETKSPLGEGEVRGVVGKLEKVSGKRILRMNQCTKLGDHRCCSLTSR